MILEEDMSAHLFLTVSAGIAGFVNDTWRSRSGGGAAPLYFCACGVGFVEAAGATAGVQSRCKWVLATQCAERSI